MLPEADNSRKLSNLPKNESVNYNNILYVSNLVFTQEFENRNKKSETEYPIHQPPDMVVYLVLTRTSCCFSIHYRRSFRKTFSRLRRLKLKKWNSAKLKHFEKK